MKLVFASLCFIFVYISFLPDARSAFVGGSELVRVRLLTTTAKVEISGVALRFQNAEHPYRPVAIPQNNRAEARLLEKDGRQFWAVRFNDRDPEQLFAQKYLMVQGENLRLGAKSLPSRVLLSSSAPRKIDVVGVMPLEEYVVGVLASEMPLSWPLETLKAQAVAARSYALAVMEERKDKPFHLESSILDQVFRHVLAEDENDPLIKKAVQAVRETQGLKLYTADGRHVLKAFFHSDCGGKTTTAKNVWNTSVNSGVTTDSSCPTNPRAHWKLALDKQELSRRLGVKDVLKLELVKIPSEDRVKAVRVAFNDSSEKIISANDFRQKLGFQDLRSSLFDLKKMGDQFLFEGRGYGHGVGLCQWGSRVLGQQGRNYKQILTHYYPLARLK